MLYALELKGKGDSRADFVALKIFKSEGEMNAYIKEKEDLASKYWTRIEPVDPNEQIEAYKYF